MTYDAFRNTSTEERVAWLADTAQQLLREIDGVSAPLAESTGLSIPMVTWGLRTTLDTVNRRGLRALAREAHEAGGSPVSTLSIVLAGNLFAATVRAVVVPLLLGIPVSVKASSRETVFPRILRDALQRMDPDLGRAIDLVLFRGGDVEQEKALIETTEVTAVYGDDSTLDAIKRRHPSASLVAHGHGVSTAYCGPEALSEDCIEETISNLGLDICAYDQRGCLSPQIVYVAAESEPALMAFGERLATGGLTRLQGELPRGPLPPEVGAAQAQWRGIAEVEGSLIAGSTYGIAIRPLRPVRWSPGYRNVSLVLVRDCAAAVRAMQPFGPMLKCVGADPASSASLHAELDGKSGLSAYECPLGSMQTPGLDAPADGKPVWHGLLR
jgi:hypothetical protein